uniref:Uncharacterized protein n=1 Tax=Tanacetum cinerariifolium TaxID=118510 RepID=A0A699IKT6_TANCI|nr:hypothetical protein [Tanacetum cinerariifolium]
MKGSEKNNETLIALTPILLVKDKRHYKLQILFVVFSSGWSFVSAVLGQMTYLVASLTLDSTSISPEGFLLPILLLVVIIVTIAIVAVILVVVVVAIVGVVIVVVIIGIVAVVGGVSFILELSFVIIGVLYRIVFYYLLH